MVDAFADGFASLMGKTAWHDPLSPTTTSSGGYTLTSTTSATPATYYTASALK